MTKQITIKEDGVSKSESVDFINTQVAGGSANWMPDDETQTGVFYVYENGEYVPSDYGFYGFFAVGVLVPGGNGAVISPTSGYVTPVPATGLGASVIGVDPTDGAMYRTEIQDVDGVPTMVKTKVADSKQDYKPVAIKILIKPAKLSYNHGEKIQYAGLVVQLLDSTGYTFVDEKFPQGIISWSPVKNLLYDWMNLITPEEYAVYKDGMTVVDTDASAVLQFVPFREAVTDFVSFDCGTGNYRYIYGASDVPVNTAILLTHGSYANTYRVQYIQASKEPFRGLSGIGSVETSVKPTNPDLYQDAGVFTNNGKSIYVRASWIGGVLNMSSPISTIPYSILDKSGKLSTSEANLIAYSMIYGSIESGTSVPVQWKSPYDGNTYEDTFEIEVKKIEDVSSGSDSSGGSSSGGGGGHSF